MSAGGITDEVDMTDSPGELYAERRDLIVVPDCNVLVHGRSLHELPWERFGVDRIEVRIVGQVVDELDRLKNKTGRPSKYARDFSAALRGLLSAPDRTDTIRPAAPVVTRRLWIGRQETKSAVRDGLNLTHGDQAILNQVLWLQDQGERVLFLTDDVLAAGRADDFGAPFMLMPPEWRRPAETDEAQKEIARLKAENLAFSRAEPDLRAAFVDEAGASVARVERDLPRFIPLQPDQVEDWMRRIEHAAPQHRFDPATTHLTARQIEDYDAAYEAWRVKARGQLEDLHLLKLKRRAWPKLSLRASNDGTRPASDVLVEIGLQGDALLARPGVWTGAVAEVDAQKRREEQEVPFPPTRPRATRMDLMFGALNRINFARPEHRFDTTRLASLYAPRKPDRFYARGEGDVLTNLLAWEAGAWRHQRNPESFVFEIAGEEAAPLRGMITARLSASNLSRPVVVGLPFRLSFYDASLEEDAERRVAAFERAMARARSSSQSLW